jgi:hypothetical protein
VSQSLDVVLVHLDDCPHWRTADERLREAMRLAGLDPARLRYRSVVTADAPADFPGSPTILVDGRDPFPTTAPTGPTCRRYEDETGPDGAPSVSQLVRILKGRQP